MYEIFESFGYSKKDFVEWKNFNTPVEELLDKFFHNLDNNADDILILNKNNN